MSVVNEQLSIGLRWLADGRRVVCALLVDAEGSSPFAPGAFMLIDGDGAIEGSITGGCVESDVGVERAGAALAGDGVPRLMPLRRLRRGSRPRGRADVRRDGRGLRARAARRGPRGLRASVRRRRRESVRTAIATLVEGPGAGREARGRRRAQVIGGLGGPELLDRTVARDLAALSERAHERAPPLRRPGRGARQRAHRPPPRIPRAADAGAGRRDRLLGGGRGARRPGRLPGRDRRRPRGVRALRALLARGRRARRLAWRRRSRRARSARATP